MPAQDFSEVRAVLFDLDGTLVDTTELIVSSHEHVLQAHLTGRTSVPRAEIIRNLGRSLPETLLEYAVADRQADAAERAEQMLQTYRDYQSANHDKMIRPFPGVREMLQGLRERGYALGVVTSKMQATARLALEMYDLQDLLPLGVYHDDTDRHKPDPAPLVEAMLRGGLAPRETAYVGDSIHDMAAGRAAGVRTLAALWGPFDRADLELERPDALVAAPEDLLHLFPRAAQPGTSR